MKLRTFKLMIKEGAVNTYKNKIMTIASTTTVLAALLIFGVFLLIAINLTFNARQIQSLPEVTVFLKPELEEMSVLQVEQQIQKDQRVAECQKVSKEQAFVELKEMIGDEYLVQGLSPDIMMISFNIRLKDPSLSKEFSTQFATIEYVADITFPQEVINLITKVVKWINAGSMLIIIILLIVAVAIISNTIKLSVYARRKEIGIMKYIGATDWFIKWPFIIEGIIIGIIGSIIAFIFTGYGYNAITHAINSQMIKLDMTIVKLVTFNKISMQIFLVYVIIGTVMGAIGSIVSVRKHLNV